MARCATAPSMATCPARSVTHRYTQRSSAGADHHRSSPICPGVIHGYPRTPASTAPERIAGWARGDGFRTCRPATPASPSWHVGRISHPSLQPGGAASRRPRR
ncbi:MAG: hypothetical protein IPL58_12760 [Betaproteobacteria bacterium]|uniref:Uncharacterized protein n=1 Tax=Candidatus Proximibacter danicus TaxID=2954365 RepID=A0A9D7K5A8_9PROT|nr:hypothetical protein [Candidatus Proximibacter danicus]